MDSREQLQADEHWLREFILDLRTLAYHAERHAEGVPTQVVRERAKQLEDRLEALLAAQGGQCYETGGLQNALLWAKKVAAKIQSDGHDGESLAEEARRIERIIVEEFPPQFRNQSPLLHSAALRSLGAAPPVQGAQEPQNANTVVNLAMLVRRLIRKHPNTKLVDQAVDYLKREGLEPGILRDESEDAS